MVKIIKETLCVEAETLKDILWYIKGSIHQTNIDISNCLFNNEHIEALLTAIEVLNKEATTKREDKDARNN